MTTLDGSWRDPASLGGLFILAGDTDAAGVGGMASDDVVTIGTVTIELDLTELNTFGDGQYPGRRLRHRFRDSANWGGGSICGGSD